MLYENKEPALSPFSKGASLYTHKKSSSDLEKRLKMHQ